jgi:hypothetical protein
MEKSGYLNITDDEKSVAYSSSSDSSYERRKRKRKEEKKKKKDKKDKKEKQKHKKRERSRRRSISKSASSEHIKQSPGDKWSTINVSDEPVITVVRKPVKVKDISDIKPNEDIDIEEKELPNFDPKETLLAKETNTVKY